METADVYHPGAGGQAARAGYLAWSGNILKVVSCPKWRWPEILIPANAEDLFNQQTVWLQAN
jgi:hypothetical protein